VRIARETWKPLDVDASLRASRGSIIDPWLCRDARGAHGRVRQEWVAVKEKRHPRVEIATRLAPANDLATQGKLQSEIADRTLSERDKIAELEFENSQLRQLVTDLLGWEEREIRRCEKAVNAPKKLPRRGRRS
jgi:hypothetical protein